MDEYFKSNTAPIFKMQFRINCYKLLVEGFFIIKKDKKYDLDWEEENFSAHLAKAIELLPSRKINGIDVSCENRNYTDEHINQGKPAKTAKRMDFFFHTWSDNNDEYVFTAEAKNISEKNWNKTKGGEVRAYDQREGYITKGIIEFVQGNYPPGCMVAYVLNGNIAPIVTDINTRITKNSHYLEKKMGTLAPSTPITIPSESSPFTEVYDSLCANQPNNKLKHFFFDLT